MIQKYSDKYEVTVAETGGNVENMNRLGAKDFQLIQSDTPCVYKAYHSEDIWEGQDYSNLRTMFPFVHAPMIFAVREDSDINTIEDLNGKAFGAGAGSQTEDAAKSALAALGLIGYLALSWLLRLLRLRYMSAHIIKLCYTRFRFVEWNGYWHRC